MLVPCAKLCTCTCAQHLLIRNLTLGGQRLGSSSLKPCKTQQDQVTGLELVDGIATSWKKEETLLRKGSQQSPGCKASTAGLKVTDAAVSSLTSTMCILYKGTRLPCS